MRKLKKALASLAIAGMVLSMAPASVFATDSDRIEGKDRYATAIKIAEKAYSEATTAVVAAGNPNNLVDALAVAPLAAQEKAPIYLTNVKDNVDVEKELLDSLDKLGVEKVFAVGAAGKDKATVDALEKAGYEVEVLAGDSRIETAEAINAKLEDPKGTIVVGLLGEADAMSVASFAAVNKYQIVIAKGDGTTSAKDVDYIVGGEARVKDIDGATRLSGNDRYETNLDVVSKLDFSYNTVYVANGRTLADALVASVLAAQTNSPILLADDRDNSVKAASYVNEKLNADSKVIALGGTAAVSNTALNKVSYKAPAALAVESVSAINAKQIEVKFNRPVDKGTAETTGNYLVADKTGTSLAVNSAVLQSDGKTVLVTMGSSLTADGKTVQVTFTVKADAIQEKGDASSVVPLYSLILNVSDNVAPSVVKVESKTNDDVATSVKITFSEPVQIPTIKINGSTKAVNTWTKENTVAEITGLTLDTKKDHTLEIINLTDNASNVTPLIKQSFSVVKDTVAPTVTSVAPYSDNSVVVTFSKRMNSSTIAGTQNILMKSEDLTPIATKNAVVYPNDTTGTKFIVQADANIFSDKSTRNITLAFLGNVIEDSLGNKLEGTTKTVTLTKDTVAPTIQGVRVLKNSSGLVTGIEVQFSEAIAANAGGYPSNITVVDKDGVDKTTNFFKTNSNAVALGETKVVFELQTPAKYSNDFTFTFAKGLVKDASEKGNDSATGKFTVNMGSPEASKFEIPQGAVTIAGTVITINYGTPVKGGAVAGSATDYRNYSLGSVNLADALIVIDSSDRSIVRIDFTNCDVPESDTNAVFTINNVQNTDGVTIRPYTNTFAVTDNVKPVLVSARVLSKTEIELTFDEAVSITGGDGTSVISDFVIKQGGVELTVAGDGDLKASSVPGYSKKIRLALSGHTDSENTVAFELNLNKAITIVTKASSKIKDTANNEMKANVTVTVEKP